VARALARWGDRLLSKLMDAPEVAGLPEADDARVDALAAAIALKEAASKALGTGWSRGVQWRHVVARAAPAPQVTLLAAAARRGERLGAQASSAWLETQGDLVIAEVWLHR